MVNEFLTDVKNRRTYYGISKESTISDEKIEEIVMDAVKHTPSAFNSQSSRAVVLLGEHHNRLWEMTMEILKVQVSEDQFPATQQKMNNFQSGFGTVLFLEDQAVVEQFQANFPSYQDRFQTWSQHGSAMLQFVIWTALENEGLGASLEHYNPLIDDKVRAEWNLPATWDLIAQMPFGKPIAAPDEKEFKPVEERVRFFK
jgi:predicted oxidoreductase (fatty acid repression mutant protein)